jgi:hypothetical protein
MTAPKGSPRIYRDTARIYIEWDSGTVLAFERSDDGLHKALKHVPIMPGNPADFRKQLKPNWTSGVVNGKRAKVALGTKIARGTTKAAQEASKLTDDMRHAADDILTKFLKKVS